MVSRSCGPWRLLHCYLFLIRIYGRYASVTGERALTAFRQPYPSRRCVMLFLIGLTVMSGLRSHGGTGILADVMATWSTTRLVAVSQLSPWASDGQRRLT